jgi:hypothetical protein
MIELAEAQPNKWGRPNAEETAAIVAALELVFTGKKARAPRTPIWRFSGRWWQ